LGALAAVVLLRGTSSHRRTVPIVTVSFLPERKVGIQSHRLSVGGSIFLHPTVLIKLFEFFNLLPDHF
jgi:hypothetical protein